MVLAEQLQDQTAVVFLLMAFRTRSFQCAEASVLVSKLILWLISCLVSIDRCYDAMGSTS